MARISAPGPMSRHDPLHGEMMLRPDFTVPVVQAHMAHGAEPARYAYLGEVFRQQERLAVGPASICRWGMRCSTAPRRKRRMPRFSRCSGTCLSGLNLRPATGDIGILMAAVRGLETTDRRKTALLRHVWRPVRFQGAAGSVRGAGAGSAGRVCAAGPSGRRERLQH